MMNESGTWVKQKKKQRPTKDFTKQIIAKVEFIE